MNILFVDHACHLKTKSADFFLDILRREHTVETHYYEKCYRCNIPKEKISAADLIVFWEFLPDRYLITIPGKPCLFVPMYDNEWGSKWQWRRIAKSGMSVLSFCDAVTRHAMSCGVKNILTVHYALDPDLFKVGVGDARQAVYWDRGNFSEDQVRALFASDAIDHLTVQRDFLPADQYDDFISRFGVYVAPRRKEGIGMAFLEQLARGKCVIAHDDATMNEYIQDGVNGVLRDFDNPGRTVSASDISRVLHSVRSCAGQCYVRWLQEQALILPFVGRAAKSVSAMSWMMRIMFVPYLLEYVCKRIKSR